MMMTVFNHRQQWSFTPRSFKIKTSIFERLISGFIGRRIQHLYETCGPNVEEKQAISIIRSSTTLFQHFVVKGYDKGVTFQQSNERSVNVAEGKNNFWEAQAVPVQSGGVGSFKLTRSMVYSALV